MNSERRVWGLLVLRRTAPSENREAVLPSPALLALLLAARLAVGLTYSFIVPPWESYDETGHYQYARYIAKYHRLLQPGDPEADRIWSKFQPPLYYLLIAPALAAYDLGESFQFPELNPLLSYGNAGINYAVTPDAPTGLELAQIQALRTARSAGVLLSTISVVFVFLIARRLWPMPGHSTKVWAATLLYAFWPQFLFVGSMVTNDLLVTALAAPILYCLIRVLQSGSRYRLLLITTLLLLAGLLTKLNALAFVPVALAALLFNLWLGHRARAALTLGALAAVTCLGLYALSTMDFVTGQILQWTTFERFWAFIQSGAHPFTTGSFEYVLKTLFAAYGWGNLETYPWVYPVWYWAGSLGLLGLARALWVRWRHSPRVAAQFAVLLLQLVSLLALTLVLAIAQQDSNLLVGRYLLPALPALVLLLVEGWSELLPTRWQRPGLLLSALSVVILSWLMPFTLIAEAYAKPQPLSAAQAQNLVHDGASDYGEAIELIGYIPSAPVLAGQRARVQMCWQVLTPITEDYFVQLELIGPDGQGYGRLVSYPRDGNYPTSFWTPGQPFCDWFELIVPEDFPAPAVGTVEVNLLQNSDGDPLPVRAADGTPLDHGTRIPVVIRAAQSPGQPTRASHYQFGPAIALMGYDAQPWPDGRGVSLTLYWQTHQPLTESYRVFTHLRTADPEVYTQSDGTPRQNSYPTSVWMPNEVIVDRHDLSLPAGADLTSVSLYVGLYRPQDGTRLPVIDEHGQPLPNDEVILDLASSR